MKHKTSKKRKRLRFKGWDLFRSLKLAVGILIVLFLLLPLATVFQMANPFDRSKIEVVIPQGLSTAAVQNILEDKGLLKKNSNFTLVARAFGIAHKLQAGKYRLSPSNTLISILFKLKKGDIYIAPPERVWITFQEGSSIYKMGEILKENKVSNYKEFKNLVHEGITERLRASHWSIFKYIPSESLEGYLYPDTYRFFKEAPVPDIIEVMLSRFEQVVLPFWENASKDTKYTLHEIITLASIIEKEAQKPEERGIISSVYHNRLNKKMFLAACPTIKYALDRPTKRVYYEQLDVDSPYNTYKNKGLPPGPICNPGIESIKAAVYPAKTNYYYFVAKKDGSHIFSSTWDEHQSARRKAGID
ncbi:MAG: endolytic transglycosylase MltG [Candidatus Margulisbacteria bacterium]|nr:endolytic transglycosylase MltG [Candidatus Margulisiibacteriota bacterium]